MITPQQIKLAVDWWTDKFQHPIFDNGDDSPRGGVGMVLAMMAHKAPTQEQVDKFRQKLTEILVQSNAVDYFGLDVDYDPCDTLMAAIDASGYTGGSMTVLPWKTHMHFRDGKVKVAMGYGAPYQELK